MLDFVIVIYYNTTLFSLRYPNPTQNTNTLQTYTHTTPQVYLSALS